MQQMAIDEKSQKLGFVGIMYIVGQPWTVLSDRYEVWDLARLRVAMPLRLASGHLCFDDVNAKRIMALSVMIHGRSGSRLFGAFGTFLFFENQQEKTLQK